MWGTWDVAQGLPSVSALLGNVVILSSRSKLYYRKDTKLVLFASLARNGHGFKEEVHGEPFATAYYCIDKDAHISPRSRAAAAGAVLL